MAAGECRGSPPSRSVRQASLSLWSSARSRAAQWRTGSGQVLSRAAGQERMHLIELCHVGLTRFVEGGGGEDQDRGVDGKIEHQRDGRVGGGEGDRLTLLGNASPVGAGLHDAGM